MNSHTFDSQCPGMNDPFYCIYLESPTPSNPNPTLPGPRAERRGTARRLARRRTPPLQLAPAHPATRTHPASLTRASRDAHTNENQ